MIIGIGIDLVHCQRMQSFLDDESKGKRFFGPEEYAYARGKSSGVESLAAAFAAKEAFGKALGTGLTDLVLSDIQVVHAENGRPQLLLQGSAEAACKKAGVGKIHVSLTHEHDMAAAYVILESV
ncbi:MAG: holo-ACP synthase [Treponemataceae bacterium]|nr:holo-ACP synthase [Treponemataceae bacterium]